MNKKWRLLVTAIAIAILTSACAAQKVDEAQVGIRYSDGFIEGQKLEKILPPGSLEYTVNDHVYKLPAGQRSYIITSKADIGDRQGDDFLVITTKDGNKLRIELSTRFFLNIREEPLTDFFLKICQKYDCWNDDGWEAMLAENFRVPLETVAATIGFGYDGSELRYSAELWEGFGEVFAGRFVEEQVKLLGRGDFFCGPGYSWEDSATGCPELPISITSVRFDNEELESIPDQRKLANEQERLAVDQERTRVAQARVEVAYAQALQGAATSERIALDQVEAVKICASNPQGCTLVVTINGESTNVAVTPGGGR